PRHRAGQSSTLRAERVQRTSSHPTGQGVVDTWKDSFNGFAPLSCYHIRLVSRTHSNPDAGNRFPEENALPTAKDAARAEPHTGPVCGSCALRSGSAQRSGVQRGGIGKLVRVILLRWWVMTVPSGSSLTMKGQVAVVTGKWVDPETPSRAK